MPSDDSQPFFSFQEPSPPRSRQQSGSAASIWAPQALTPDTAWPRAFEAFSGVAEKEHPKGLYADLQLKTPPTVRREDVFGPIVTGNPPLKNVGAIGEGRKKSDSELDDSVRLFLSERIFSPR